MKTMNCYGKAMKMNDELLYGKALILVPNSKFLQCHLKVKCRATAYSRGSSLSGLLFVTEQH